MKKKKNETTKTQRYWQTHSANILSHAKNVKLGEKMLKKRWSHSQQNSKRWSTLIGMIWEGVGMLDGCSLAQGLKCHRVRTAGDWEGRETECFTQKVEAKMRWKWVPSEERGWRRRGMVYPYKQTSGRFWSGYLLTVWNKNIGTCSIYFSQIIRHSPYLETFMWFESQTLLMWFVIYFIELFLHLSKGKN